MSPMIKSGGSAAQQLLSMPLLIVLVALVPLAQASPIDPSWIAGLWDGGDSDDAVLLAISTPGTVDVAPTPETQAFLIAVGFLVFAEPNHPPITTWVPSPGRAPPLR